MRKTKAMGQNFLISESIINKIIDISKINKDDVVFEIGPGKGALTRHIIQLAKRVVAVEKDKILYDYLARNLGSTCSNLLLVNEDILKIDIQNLFKNVEKIKIVSNLPYSIAKRVIAFIIEYKNIIDFSVLMVQEEVGLRLIAQPSCKNYSPISIFPQNFFDVIKNFSLGPQHFFPRPKVSSMVLTLKRREKPICEPIDFQLFCNIVNGAFQHRRKKMVNSLSFARSINKEKLIAILQKLDLRADIRAEDISIEKYGRIVELLYERGF